jgi:hypothetical protein
MIFRLTLLLGLLLSMASAYGQNADFKVMINKERLQPGDTLDLIADYNIGGRELPPATFALTILGPNEKIWQLRWPMLDGHSEASIVFPDSATAGAYNLLFAVQPRFLKLFGEVIHPESPCELTVNIAAGVTLKQLPIKTAPNGKFVIDNLLLEGTASMGFTHDYNLGEIRCLAGFKLSTCGHRGQANCGQSEGRKRLFTGTIEKGFGFCRRLFLFLSPIPVAAKIGEVQAPERFGTI